MSIGSHRDDVAILLQRARQHVSEKAFNQACKDYMKVLQFDPDNYEASYEIAEILFRRSRQPDRALKYYESAMNLNLESDDPVRGRCEALMAMGRGNQARAVMEKYAASSAATAYGWLRKGVVLQSFGETKTAEKAFVKAAQQGQKSRKELRFGCQAMLQLAELLNWTDREKESLQWYNKYFKYRPRDAKAVQGYAAALDATGQHQQAIKSLRRYVKLVPLTTWPYLAISRVYALELKDITNSIKYLDLYERSESDKKGLALAAQTRGMIEEWQGRLAEAVEAFEQAVKFNHKDPKTFYSLARLLEAVGQYRRASKVAQQAEVLMEKIPPSDTFEIEASNQIKHGDLLINHQRPAVKNIIRQMALPTAS